MELTFHFKDLIMRLKDVNFLFETHTATGSEHFICQDSTCSVSNYL